MESIFNYMGQLQPQVFFDSGAVACQEMLTSFIAYRRRINFLFKSTFNISVRRTPLHLLHRKIHSRLPLLPFDFPSVQSFYTYSLQAIEKEET